MQHRATLLHRSCLQADPPVAPRSLYTCAARLIAAGLVKLAELRVHLEPMAAQAKASYERWCAELARKTKNYGKVSGSGLSGRGLSGRGLSGRGLSGRGLSECAELARKTKNYGKVL
jgi:hypothetical protein